MYICDHEILNQVSMERCIRHVYTGLQQLGYEEIIDG